MIIRSYQVYRYSLRFRGTVRVGQVSLGERQGLLLRLEGDDGAVGWGEIAPLPGFSPELLSEALGQVRALVPGIIGKDVDEAAVLSGSLVPAGTCSSVRFGVEAACLDSLKASGETTLMGPGGGRLPVCRLLEGPPETWADLASASRGFTCFKVKVGRRPHREEIEGVHALSTALPAGGTLRLDANRAWNFEEARLFCSEVEDLEVQYVEEPLADPAAWPRLAACTGVATAADESLVSHEDHLLGTAGAPEWVVLKPTLTGGVSGTLRLARRARENGRRVVISSMYETGVGLGMLARLAVRLQEPGVAAGLDTSCALAEDVVLPSPVVTDGHLDVSGDTLDMNKTNLERVTRG